MADDGERDRPLTLRQMLGSALAAAIGVQTREARERDFARGRPAQFVVIGVACTVVLVVLIVLLVRFVLGAAA